MIILEILIRDATIEDAKKISEIGVMSWKTAYIGIISDEYLDSLSMEKRNKYILNSLKEGHKHYIIAEYEGQAVGMSCFYPRSKEGPVADEWELEAIYLLPQFWSKGIGIKLIQRAFRYMHDQQADACGLWVLQENLRARRFYEDIGFKDIGIEKSITIGGEELIEIRYLIDLNQEKTNQPKYINIDESLRLRKFDGEFDFALDWYKDKETVKLVDGEDAELYDVNILEKMYNYLNNKGELYFIEVKESDDFLPIGDVTFWAEDMPIVIGDKNYRGKGIGYKVIKALVQRAQMLGYNEVYINEIYSYNTVSQKAFEKAGFRKYKENKDGYSYVLKLK